jgi:demethylmenaquinone methyltransferase/2-methoxy-6-polyprenyl-1,4-benzoquinol methylase
MRPESPYMIAADPTEPRLRRAATADEMRHSFGARAVGEGEKQGLVNEVFDRVASRYDLMNDLMSAGAHRLWKDAMVARLGPPRTPGRPWHGLDVAGGTGDIARRILAVGGDGVRVTVLDINAAMLEAGLARRQNERFGDRIDFVLGNAEKLDFPANRFDAYTIAFGIRNVPDIPAALAEAFRVLKPGGRFLCLEFSQVDLPGFDRLYEQWARHVIPSIARVVTGDDAAYRYLVESIEKFPNQRRFGEMIAQAGLRRVACDNFAGGLVALHSAWKL